MSSRRFASSTSTTLNCWTRTALSSSNSRSVARGLASALLLITLSGHPSLLQQQHLIELIRRQEVEEALAFAQEQLSVDEDYLQLSELERTLALLAFDKPENSPYADLLHLSHRQQLASEINQCILREQLGSDDSSQPQLVTLVKLLLWTQEELRKKKVPFPEMTDLTTASIQDRD